MVYRVGLKIPSLIRKPCNLQALNSSVYVPAKSYIISYSFSTEGTKSVNDEVEEKKRKFLEVERKYKEFLQFEKLSEDEKKIHALHAEAVAKGHFTYDDPVTGDRIVTRLRHFLKGKCCGKSCRHCIYEQSGVIDEEKKSRAWFNSSFWQYDDSQDNSADAFDRHEVVSLGRGPYPRKYAQNAKTNMFRISTSHQIKSNTDE